VGRRGTNTSSASFISGLAARNPSWIRFHVADFVSEEGKTFPYVYLSSSANSSATSRDSGKLRVWIQGSVHGNEPAGDEATLTLLGAMDANTTWAASFLEAMDIVVLPRYNPDGNACKSCMWLHWMVVSDFALDFQRTLATNFDPNRDHTKLVRQQTRDIKEWFSSFSPHIAIDMHEYGAASRYAGNYSNAADGMYSAAKVRTSIVQSYGD
jgi:murein tripeptide amidase MpaA